MLTCGGLSPTIVMAADVAVRPALSVALTVNEILPDVVGVQLIEYDEAALRDVAGHVVALAQAEDLPAHGEAVSARFAS